MSELAIKSLQKEVLSNFEDELLDKMSPEHFNALRKLVFRSTFLAYRLGVLGLDRDVASYEKLCGIAIGALRTISLTPLVDLPPDLQDEVMEYSLRTWLEAFRIGALSLAERKHEV